MSRSLVTGGHGFIASHLARALVERGDEVVVVDKANPAPGHSGLEMQGIADQVELINADLAEPGAVATILGGCGSFDSVFHLAAQTLVGPAFLEPVKTFEANLEGTWNLLEGLRGQEMSPRVIVASSDKAYGPSEDLPYREDQVLRPASPYEASKAATEMIAAAYCRSYAIGVAVTRFANVYGGGDLNLSRLIPELMLARVDGRRPEIRSDGSPERDYLYIDDAVAAYIAIDEFLATSGQPARFHSFNAGSGRSWSVRELVEKIGTVTGKPLDAIYRGAGVPLGEIDRQWVDSTKLKQLTGWQPQVGLDEGLRRTFEWYSRNVDLVTDAAPQAS